MRNERRDRISNAYELEAERIIELKGNEKYDGDFENPVFGEGNVDSLFMLIGEAPGAEEAKRGKPFVGKAGKQLDELLEKAGISRKNGFVTNTVKYRPVKQKTKTVSNRTPTKAELLAGIQTLKIEILEVKPKIIVTLGNTPLEAILTLANDKTHKGSKIGELHGKQIAITIDGISYLWFPIYHPASIIYNRALKEIYEADLIKLNAVIKKEKTMKNKFFDEIKNKFGFGCMRLPMKDGENGKEVDYDEFSKMVDMFIDNGFNYFDTAHGYISGKSEIAIRECLSKRHNREEFLLTDKLTDPYFSKQEDIRPFFESQLEACGVEYFDFYLMHAQNARNYEKFKACKAYETALELKNEGKIKHFGISFHDKADVLDRILTEYPQIEAVQIQFNYVDYLDAAVQSKLCYEVCVKHNKPTIVMEPVKGGSLVNIPDDAKKVFDEVGNGLSYASYAIRFAAGFDNMMMVLSGMSSLEQMQDNISYMKDFEPLNEKEMKAVNAVQEIFRAQDMIPCTACRYCVDGCPKHISIPDLFACLNAKKQHKDWNSSYYYHSVHTKNNGKAGDCIKCGKCEKVCPQNLQIRKLLEEVSEVFDNEADDD